MKKLVVMLMWMICGLTASAQVQKGLSSAGFNLGYGFSSKNAIIGVDYRYCITDEFRISPSLSCFVKNDGLSAWALDLNVHYVFKLSDMFGFYPLAGLDLSFWKYRYWEGGSSNKTRFGANIGMGAEVYASDLITVGIEGKYNAIKHWDQAILSLRVGYSF